VKHRVGQGFNFLAPFYELGVRLFFGRAIFESQIFFLSRFSRSKSVLVFGGGSGHLLSALALKHTPEHVCYIDISEKMILKAREQILRDAPFFLNRIDFICGSAADIPVNQTFDLIITPYVLDCIADPELESVMNALHEVLLAGGSWLFSDFNIPEKGFHRIRGLLITRLLYFFFNLICGLGISRLPDFNKAFCKLKLREVESRNFRAGLLISKVYVRI
jgi:SAM-dependent methyltransferase